MPDHAASPAGHSPYGWRLPFGWRWIGRVLLLRRRQAITMLGVIGIIYAAGLVFPIAMQTAVDEVVARRAGPELLILVVVAVAALGIEIALTY
jgi:ATP-binding cassette subfamily B protein